MILMISFARGGDGDGDRNIPKFIIIDEHTVNYI